MLHRLQSTTQSFMLNNEVHTLHNIPNTHNITSATPSPALPQLSQHEFFLTAGHRMAEPVHAGQSFSFNTARAFDADTAMATKTKKSLQPVVVGDIYIECLQL